MIGACLRLIDWRTRSDLLVDATQYNSIHEQRIARSVFSRLLPFSRSLADILLFVVVCLARIQSGIQPTSETLNIVDELRKNNSKYIFALFKIDNTTIVPDSQYPENADDTKAIRSSDDAYAKNFKDQVWPAFLAAMEKADGPRFSVIDFAFRHADGRVVRVLTSIGWCPDRGTSAKTKMTFASTKTAFEAKINIGKKYQANDVSDLEYQTVYDFVSLNK